MEQQTTALKKWKEDQSRQVGRAALEHTDAYAVAACRILALRRLQQTANEAEIATASGLQPYFLNRWITVIQESTEIPHVAELRNAANQVADPAVVNSAEFLQQEAANLNVAVAAAISALKSSEPSASEPAQTQPVPVPAEQEHLLKLLWKNPAAPFFVAETDLAGLLAESDRKQMDALQSQLDELTKHPAASGPMMPSIQGGGQPMQVFVRGNPENLGEPAPPDSFRF